MYDCFTGSIRHLDADGRLSLVVAGVGYLLRISERTRQALSLDGTTVTVLARLIVREDDLLLFGFHDAGERACFDLLLSVQGVGPQVALALCSSFAPEELQQILLNKDTATLTKVKGVGRKSAERITLELSDKAEKIPVPLPGFQDPATQPANQAVAEQVRQGLVALGYGNKEAERAIAAAQTDTSTALTAEELLRLALAALRSA
jgi:Holliday junction DNA helicase RuvA